MLFEVADEAGRKTIGVEATVPGGMAERSLRGVPAQACFQPAMRLRRSSVATSACTDMGRWKSWARLSDSVHITRTGLPA